MLLQKQVSRKTKNKVYSKWVLTIPNNAVSNLNWKSGDNLKEDISNGKLVVSLLSTKKEKIKIIRKSSKITAFERLSKIYSSLPLAERKLPVIVIDDSPISWDLAYKELKYNTKLGKLIGV